MSSNNEKGKTPESIREKDVATVEDKETSPSSSFSSDKEDGIDEKKGRESPEDFDIEAQDVRNDYSQSHTALLTCFIGYHPS